MLAPAFFTSGLFAFLVKTLPILMLQYLEEPRPDHRRRLLGLILRTIVVLLVADRLVGLRRLAEF